jgi:hypothetical protein
MGGGRRNVNLDNRTSRRILPEFLFYKKYVKAIEKMLTSFLIYEKTLLA